MGLFRKREKTTRDPHRIAVDNLSLDIPDDMNAYQIAEAYPFKANGVHGELDTPVIVLGEERKYACAKCLEHRRLTPFVDPNDLVTHERGHIDKPPSPLAGPSKELDELEKTARSISRHLNGEDTGRRRRRS